LFVCLFVCLSVCPVAYLRNHTAELHQFFGMLRPVVVARSSYDGVMIRYVFPVLWIT